MFLDSVLVSSNNVIAADWIWREIPSMNTNSTNIFFYWFFGRLNEMINLHSDNIWRNDSPILCADHIVDQFIIFRGIHIHNASNIQNVCHFCAYRTAIGKIQRDFVRFQYVRIIVVADNESSLTLTIFVDSLATSCVVSLVIHFWSFIFRMNFSVKRLNVFEICIF